MYEPKNYDHLLGTPGFSDDLLKNHFTLYQGYVTNTNKLNDELMALGKEDKGTTPAFAELNRRRGWEFNGMRLHELYFDNMSKEPINDPSLWESPLVQKMTEVYGNPENWKKNFIEVGKMRGIGWVILYHDMVKNELFNVWINEHDTGHFAGCTPLLVMDVFEHAFMLDYGIKRADYIEAFWNAIDWKVVHGRFQI